MGRQVLIGAWFIFAITVNAEAGFLDNVVSGVKDSLVETTSDAILNTTEDASTNQRTTVGVKEEATTGIIDNGVFDVKMDEKNDSPVTVFGITLGSTVQDVVKVLEEKGIEIKRGYRQDSEMEIYKENLKDSVSRFYDRNGIVGSEKEAALAVVDANKIKFHSFMYNNKECWISPSSLDFFFQSNYRPVFNKYYNEYNSTFYLELYNLSEDLTSQGIYSMNLVFGSINQEDPRLFLVSIKFRDGSATQVPAILNKKYGMPNVYYPSLKGVGTAEVINEEAAVSKGPKLRSFFNYLCEKSKGCEEKKSEDIILSDLLKNLILTDSMILRSIIWTGYIDREVEFGSPWCVFVMEWDINDAKIIGSFISKGDSELVIGSRGINYLFWPFAKEILDGTSRVIEASKDVENEVKNDAAQGF